jgi:hypothetical protein
MEHIAERFRFSMAQAADPAGVRTVGVVTKCDALEPGDEGRVSWLGSSECRRV